MRSISSNPVSIIQNMVETKLILIEGIPGAGKSTLQDYLYQQYKLHGIPSQIFTEEARDHPIRFSFTYTSDDFRQKYPAEWEIFYKKNPGYNKNGFLNRYWQDIAINQMLHDWESFVKNSINDQTVTIMDSRFWNAISLPMVYSEFSVEEVIDVNKRIASIINPIQPVLINLYTTDVKGDISRLPEIRGEKWADFLVKRDRDCSWFVSRGYRDWEGMIIFWDEFIKLTEMMHAYLEFPKLKLVNPHEDWDASYNKIHEFLNLKCITK